MSFSPPAHLNPDCPRFPYVFQVEGLSVKELTALISADKNNPVLRYRRAVAILLSTASDAAYLECEKASTLFVEAAKADVSNTELKASAVQNLTLLGSLLMLRGQFDAVGVRFGVECCRGAGAGDGAAAVLAVVLCSLPWHGC